MYSFFRIYLVNLLSLFHQRSILSINRNTITWGGKTAPKLGFWQVCLPHMQTHTDVNFHPKAFARVAHVKYNNGLFCARGVGMGASLAFCNFLLPLLIKKNNNKKSRKFEFLPNCTLNSSSWTPPTSFNAHYITYCFIAHIFFNIFGTYRTISFKFYENNLLRAIKQLFWVRDTESKSPQRNMLKQSITSPSSYVIRQKVWW